MDRERILAKLDEMEQYLGELETIVTDSLEEYLASVNKKGNRKASSDSHRGGYGHLCLAGEGIEAWPAIC